MSDIQLTVEALTKGFGTTKAVDAVSFTVAQGEFVSLLGPSGCGKTTLLRLIAGFERPDGGGIVSRDRVITMLPPYRRRFGVVFQSYALFPHMSVLENVGYGLKVRGVPRGQATMQARAALARVGLDYAEDRFPRQLSGGQQQRVALARAIVVEPDMLLLDEPFSALDKGLREEMQVELRQLQKRIGIATLFVTHDQEEALTLSDRVAVMRAGRILQMDTPRAVYDQPTSRFVATFLGTTNLLRGSWLSPGRVDIEGAEMQIRNAVAPPMPSVTLAVRPEHVRVEPASTGRGVAGHVREVLFQGHRLIILFETTRGQQIRSFHAPADNWSPAPGNAATVSWPAAQASLIGDDV